MTFHCVDKNGKWLGGYDIPPEGAVIVPEAPLDARQVWNGTGYSARPTDQDREDEEALANAEAANRLLVEVIEKSSIDPATLTNKAIYDKLKAATGRKS